jgi:hypothetical protein
VSDDERLSSEIETLLDAERDFDGPAGDKRARLLSRLGPLLIPGAIGAGVGATAAVTSSAAETAATGKAAGVLGAGLKAKLAVAALAGAVGAVGGAVTQSALGPTSEQKPAPAAPASVRTVAPPPAETAAARPEPEATTSATASAAPATSTSAPSRGGASTTANLRAERLLLERATAALMRGDANSALGALREHAQRFPRGELAEEREVLRVRALRAAGQNDAADQSAKDFKRQFPSSLQQGIIDAGPSKP